MLSFSVSQRHFRIPQLRFVMGLHDCATTYMNTYSLISSIDDVCLEIVFSPMPLGRLFSVQGGWRMRVSPASLVRCEYNRCSLRGSFANPPTSLSAPTATYGGAYGKAWLMRKNSSLFRDATDGNRCPVA
jgi:hypothetical protein